MATATQLPLPHFLNLPLPPIPSDPSSFSSTTSPSSNQQPLIFKLNLSPDQFEELLNLDAEIEEGEEGGLRLEFDPSGKGKLHLSPNRLLLLNPPRSGPSRTNKPEEIYYHTPISTPSSSRSPLTGLLKIPTSTCVYDLQRVSSSDHSSALNNTNHAESAQPNESNHHNSQPIKTSRPTAELSQREKLAGQRLKEKRLEEDRKKKEKQMVVLPDGPATTTATKRTRQAKSKAPNKTQSGVTIKQQSTAATTNTVLSSSKHQSQTIAPVAQLLPPRRALPGSQTGKHLAHVHNQHLSHPPTPPLKPVSSQLKPEPSPLPQPLPIPSPPAVVFKPPNSSRRAKPVSLDHSALPEAKVAHPSEPPSATKFSTNTGLSSLSDEGEVNHRTSDTTPQALKPPTPPLRSLKHSDSSQLLKASPRPDVFKNESQIQASHTAFADPAGNALACNRTNSATTHSNRSSSKRTVESATGKLVHPSKNEHIENSEDRDVPSSPSKRHRPEMLTPNPNPAPPPSRPRKSQKRDESDHRLAQSNLEPLHATEPPPSNGRPHKTEEQPRNATITVKKVAVAMVTERNQPSTTSQIENAATVPLARKRVLEAENDRNSLNKRVRQDEVGSGLPTIRKVVRPSVNGDITSAAHTTHESNKRVKKKKKVKQPIDYTSSEVEEGEEPGEIVRSSARSRPPPVPIVRSTVVCTQEATETHPPPSNHLVSSLTIPPEPTTDDPPLSRSNNQAITQHVDKSVVSVSSKPPPAVKKEDSIPNHNSSSYNSSRLLFYKLSKHYEFVCLRLEEFKENKRRVGSFQEVEELLFEAYGLEIELDRVKNRIIRNYS